MSVLRGVAPLPLRQRSQSGPHPGKNRREAPDRRKRLVQQRIDDRRDAFFHATDATRDLLQFVPDLLKPVERIANFRKGGKGGHIVNIAARPALNPRQGANMTAYTASKAAVAAFTVALAEELKNDDISAIALAPSTLDTPANRKDMPTAKHDTWVKPTAIAELIVGHCSLSETINSGVVMPVYGKA
jgi:NAD(P)-dependent dehydrogenase (short-subunit alcohol dehydrogenase family)